MVRPRRAITYRLTRWDLWANFLTIFLRSWIIQVFIVVAMLFNGWLFVGPGITTRPFFLTVLKGVLFLITFVGLMVVCQCVLGLATAFLLKQSGLVGQHVLEITEAGLIERTEFNETLHKWPAVCRILSVCGYLYIYVSDNNSHQVPKRCFSAQEIADFEADVRAHARNLRS